VELSPGVRGLGILLGRGSIVRTGQSPKRPNYRHRGFYVSNYFLGLRILTLSTFPSKGLISLAENATPTALFSLQSESSQERRRSIAEPVSGELEAQDHNTAPSARLPFPNYPHFHPRTRYLHGTLLDVTVRSTIILTTLELVLAIHFISIAPDVGLSLNR
jgi:hypothetical protein